MKLVPSSVVMLKIIEEHPYITRREISEMRGIRRESPSMSKPLTRLASYGWIIESKVDRKMRISLTDKGIEALDLIRRLEALE